MNCAMKSLKLVACSSSRALASFSARSFSVAICSANILVLDVLVIYYMIESYPVRKSSAYLFVPYLLWLLLATYLNGYMRRISVPQ